MAVGIADIRQALVPEIRIPRPKIAPGFAWRTQEIIRLREASAPSGISEHDGLCRRDDLGQVAGRVIVAAAEVKIATDVGRIVAVAVIRPVVFTNWEDIVGAAVDRPGRRVSSKQTGCPDRLGMLPEVPGITADIGRTGHFIIVRGVHHPG